MNVTELAENNYVPYSNEKNVAVVKSENGKYFPGVRVENLVFPLTVSAIQNAIYCCLSEGEKPQVLFAKDHSNPLTPFWIKEYNLTVQPFDQLSNIAFTEVLLNDIDLEETLHKLLRNAFAENSEFPVSCLLATDGGFISGMNIENSEWTSGLCAERVAISKAFAYGLTEFNAIYIATKDGEFCSPCGACRQVLAEHLLRKKVYLYHPDGSKSAYYSSDLLPYRLQSSSLQK